MYLYTIKEIKKETFNNSTNLRKMLDFFKNQAIKKNHIRLLQNQYGDFNLTNLGAKATFFPQSPLSFQEVKYLERKYKAVVNKQGTVFSVPVFFENVKRGAFK